MEKGLKPAIVSGISSGAVNATLLCGAPDPDNRLQTLIKVWDELTIPLESITKVWDELGFRIGTLPSTWSNPAMYRPRTDYLKFWELTSFYDTSPLRETLSKYVAWDKLTFDELKPVDPSQPRLILAATNIETGKIDAFDSRRMTIEPDHVLASGALPPGFPAAAARDVHGHTYTYWDGGLYNNTPLAQVIHALENENRQGQTKKVDMMIVVNLFPKKSRLPVNLFEVTDRSCEIIFATKTSSDSRRASETRKVIGLKDELEGLIKNLPDDTKTKFAALMKHPGYDVLEKWKPVFDDLIEIAYTEPEPMDAAINFAKETIERRRRAGYRDAMARYEEYWKHPKTPELQRRSHSFNAGRRRRGNTWPAGKKEGANMELRFEQKSFFSLSVRSALQNAGMFGPARSSGPESGQETDRPGGSEATAPAQPSPPPIGAAPPDFHRIAYTQWGDPHSEHIVCVHGFARNGRDFDFLAERLSTRTCVVCPDIVGRGRSDWLRDPTTNFGYSYAQYMLDITGLIGCLSVHEVDWIGTSLGGLLGMMMAAAPRSPVRRLVMNDVGPQLPASLTPSLLDYLADEHIFSSPEELREFLREHYCGATKFGNLTEVQLRHMAKYSERRLPDGRIGLAFDHENMSYSKWMRDNNTPFEDVKLWDVWTSVRCPVLVLHGANSPVLLEETVLRMHREGPRANIITIPDCGHAPALMSNAQISLIDTWLKTTEIDQNILTALGASVLAH